MPSPRPSDEEFESLGYSVSTENRKKVIRTPEGVKLDVFTRDVSGIPISEVFRTAIKKRVEPEEIGHMSRGSDGCEDARITLSRYRGLADHVPTPRKDGTLECY